MADILVVRTTVHVKKEALDILRDDILAQKEKGVIVLPFFCRAMLVPDDVEVLVEDYPGEVAKGEKE